MLSYFVDHVDAMGSLFSPIEEHGFGIDRDGDVGKAITAASTEYRARFDTFKHGAFHGLLLSIMFLLPVMATNAMFERKSGKYILVNWGYWTLTLILMGGVLCQWA